MPLVADQVSIGETDRDEVGVSTSAQWCSISLILASLKWAYTQMMVEYGVPYHLMINIIFLQMHTFLPSATHALTS